MFHYYTVIVDLRLSIIFSLSSGDIYLSLGISLASSFVNVSKLFCCEVFETFVIPLAILLPIKSLGWTEQRIIFYILLFD